MVQVIEDGKLDNAYVDSCFRLLDSGEIDQLLGSLDLGTRDPKTLDIGCGPGHWLIAARRTLGGTVLGGDISADHFATAQREARKRNADNIRLAEMDICHLPLNDSALDCIFCRGVISLVHDENQAVAEMGRILRPGGYLLLGDAGIGFNMKLLLNGPLKSRLIASKFAINTLFYFLTGLKIRPNSTYPVWRLRSLLERNGFKLRQVKIKPYLGFPDWITCIAQKTID